MNPDKKKFSNSKQIYGNNNQTIHLIMSFFYLIVILHIRMSKFVIKYIYLGVFMESIINRQFSYNGIYYLPNYMSVSRRRVLSMSVLLFEWQGLDEAPLIFPAWFVLLLLIVSCAYSLVCGILIIFFLFLNVFKRIAIAAQRSSDNESTLIQRHEP